MAGRLYNRRERFARNWKLVGIPSKFRWQGSLLNNKIISQAISRLVDKFSVQTISIIEDICYELGKEDAHQLKETLKIKQNNARSCLEPIEMVCLLNGIDAETISVKYDKASLKIKNCPFEDVLAGIVPNFTVCKHYFNGMAQTINPNARLTQPEKRCQDCGECEFVITISG